METRIPTHPGDVLKEELESREISQKKFANLIEVPLTQLNDILNGKRAVTADFALKIEAALGINSNLLINMQNRYNVAVAYKKPLFIEQLNSIRQKFAAAL